MSLLFTPSRPDGKAEWRVVYELAKPLNIGETLTFEAICGALDREPDDLAPIYRAVGRATRELRRYNQRSLESVTGIGYRVLHPKEHELQARRYQRASRRKMVTSLEVVRATNLELLNDTERQRAIALGMVLQGMCQAITSLDRRQRRTEEILVKMHVETKDRLEHTENQVSRLASAMREAGLLE